MAKATINYCPVCSKERSEDRKTCGDQSCINALRYAKYPPKPFSDCARCGAKCKSSLQPNANRAFCTRKCWKDQLEDERNQRKKTCEICSATFIGGNSHPSRFCSLECTYAWQRSDSYIPARKARLRGCCDQCEAEIHGRKGIVRSKILFCNNECFVAYGLEKQWLRPCDGCGVPLRRSSKQKAVYCSTRCMSNHTNTRKPTSTCEFCGVEFSGVRIRSGGYYKTDRKVCSYECDNKRRIQYEAETGSRTGPNSPQWQGGVGSYRGSGWLRLSERIRERDNHECQDCGISEAECGRAMQVHHKIPFNQFRGDNAKANKPSNLVSLCPSCHTAADWEWRRMNSVQLVMALDGSNHKPTLLKPKMPQDLTGVTVNGLRVISKVPHDDVKKKKTVKWNYECSLCGHVGVKHRQNIVDAKNPHHCCKGGRGNHITSTAALNRTKNDSSVS